MKYSKHVSLFFSLFFCQGLRSMCISKPPACWWQWARSKGITLMNTQCWADLTGDTVVWRDPPPKKSDPESEEKNKRVNRADHRCVLVTPHVTVQWCDLGQSGQQSLDWLSRPVQYTDAIWCQKDRRLSQQKDPFLSSPLVFIALSRICSGTVCQIHCQLPRSVNLIGPAMLPPTFPLSLILSCPFHLALIFLFTIPPQMSCESVMQHRAAGLGEASNKSPMDR